MASCMWKQSLHSQWNIETLRAEIFNSASTNDEVFACSEICRVSCIKEKQWYPVLLYLKRKKRKGKYRMSIMKIPRITTFIRPHGWWVLANQLLPYALTAVELSSHLLTKLDLSTIKRFSSIWSIASLDEIPWRSLLTRLSCGNRTEKALGVARLLGTRSRGKYTFSRGDRRSRPRDHYITGMLPMRWCIKVAFAIGELLIY